MFRRTPSTAHHRLCLLHARWQPIGVAEQNAGAVIPAMEIPEDGVEESRVETQNTPAPTDGGAELSAW